MNEEWRMVRDFHEVFGHGCPDEPRFLDEERLSVRVKWVEEELGELLEAETIYDQADAVIDAMYFLLGTLVEMGLQPDSLFSVVHAANMAKVWPDGRAHYNADGKVIKPEGWVSPMTGMVRAVDEQRGQGSPAPQAAAIRPRREEA